MSVLSRIAAIAGLLILIGITPARGQDASTCAPEYAQAETAYFDAAFDRAIRLLRTCLEEADLPADVQVRFYRLLSFAYIAQDEQAEARAAIEQLLDVAPGYTPDPETDRPDYVALVREVKATRASSEAGGRRWLRWVLGGAGAVAVGVLAVVLVGGGDGGGPDDLPAPPLPSN